MSITFFIKKPENKKIMSINEIINFSENRLSQYSFDENSENAEELKNNPINMHECVLFGEEGRSSRGFEFSYNNSSGFYEIRVYTPCTIEDWETALEFMEKTAVSFHLDVVDEHGRIYKNGIIDYPYINDIEYGLEMMKEKISSMQNLAVQGIFRPASFNEKILDEIINSENPARNFSNFIYNIQYLDAYSANQHFYKTDEEKIIGVYTLTESVRTILPYKPSVDFFNLEIVKNEDVSEWQICLVEINGDPDDENSYETTGILNYDDFIAKLPKEKYYFIDAVYIVVEGMTKEEIKSFLN